MGTLRYSTGCEERYKNCLTSLTSLTSRDTEDGQGKRKTRGARKRKIILLERGNGN
jgi:hypothetical protein